VFGILGIVVLLLVVVLVSLGAWTAHRSFPQLSGEVEVPGLGGSVEVIRDSHGVPQIYADNRSDLFFAQGYVHAQDRFWEMDFRRHITAGRLSEMFGDSSLDTDKVIRTMGWRRVAEQEYRMLSDRSRESLQSYAAGVNAYLAERSPAELSLEYVVLGLINSEYEIEPWDPVDSVAWLKALAWDLRSNMDDEIARAVASASVGVERTEELYPPYPYDRHRPIVEDARSGAEDQVPVQAAVYREGAAAMSDARAAFDAVETVLGPAGEGIGSNSWVVAASKTQTGKPFLANDPHLGPTMPSLWYQAGLHCRTVDAQCDVDVAGWTMSGVPGVFIGHNDTIAWGFTNLGPDVTDLVLEKVDGDTYQIDGRRKKLRTRDEVIKVAGGDDVTVTVRSTPNGPIMSDVLESVAAAGEDAPVPAPGQDRPVPEGDGDGYAVALKWTALTPRPTFDGFDELNTARTWEEFREGARLVSVPSQNLVYADTTGTIGYQAPGVIPIRTGYDGKWPVPGWTSDYDWTGEIPFDELPSITDPPEGYIVTANQAAVGPEYPYFITDDWSYGARSQRIFDLLEEGLGTGPVTAQQMRDIQMDAHNEVAAFLVPRLIGYEAANAEALGLLDGWDFQQQRDSAPGAYFNAVWKQLVERVFNDELDTSETYANAGDRYWEVMYRLWEQPDNPWWDDVRTPEVEDRDQTVVASLDAAADELTQRLGGDPEDWRWGALHTLTLTNQSLGTSGVAPVEWLFNRGPYEAGGGSSIVQATGWEPSEGYEVDWVPSMRQVIDLADFDASTWVNLTGASGHAFSPTYRDQTQAWVSGEQFPWPYSREAVDSAGRDVLTLQPPQ
jgi:penicillin amidase